MEDAAHPVQRPGGDGGGTAGRRGGSAMGLRVPVTEQDLGPLAE